MTVPSRLLTVVSGLSLTGGAFVAFTEALPPAWRAKVTAAATLIVFLAQGFARGWAAPKAPPSPPGPTP